MKRSSMDSGMEGTMVSMLSKTGNHDTPHGRIHRLSTNEVISWKHYAGEPNTTLRLLLLPRRVRVPFLP